MTDVATDPTEEDVSPAGYVKHYLKLLDIRLSGGLLNEILELNHALFVVPSKQVIAHDDARGPYRDQQYENSIYNLFVQVLYAAVRLTYIVCSATPLRRQNYTYRDWFEDNPDPTETYAQYDFWIVSEKMKR